MTGRIEPPPNDGLSIRSDVTVSRPWDEERDRPLVERLSYKTPQTVNDGESLIGACWVCGDLLDHDGHPHGAATGDGLTRADILLHLQDTLHRLAFGARPVSGTSTWVLRNADDEIAAITGPSELDLWWEPWVTVVRIFDVVDGASTLQLTVPVEGIPGPFWLEKRLEL